MTCLRARIFFLIGLLVGANPAEAQFEPWNPLPMVFFPPTPPIYGAAIENEPANRVRSYKGRRLFPPEGLADFVNEGFYPALSTRLFGAALRPATELRLQQFQARRLSQVTALLDQLVTLHGEPPEVQERLLRTFAETQTPQLVALEMEAEALRQDIVSGGFFASDVDWNTSRAWRLDEIQGDPNGTVAEGEFQVVRARAFYQKGVLPQQRGLLRELAMELETVARKARGLPTAREESDAMFFSPETARIRLPVTASAELREKMGLYNGLKTALKRELRDTVMAQDGAMASERERAFEVLADRQWPQLAMLERMADEIRILLAPHLAVTTPAAPPWIPAGLLEAIRAYTRDREIYFEGLRQLVTSAIMLVPRPDLFNLAGDERVRVQREFVARQAEVRRQAFNEYQARHAARFEELGLRYKAIREGLAVVAEKQTDRKTGRPLDADTLLRQYAVSMEEFETFGRASTIYANYRIAMLQPGLSPEQRRLLFGYALVGLAQPLPNGELMPAYGVKRPVAAW